MIKEEFIKKIQDYIGSHCEAKDWDVIGERGKVLTFFEKVEIFFRPSQRRICRDSLGRNLGNKFGTSVRF